MPVFTYRGTNRAGGTVSGEQMAPSKAELLNLLKRQQITRHQNVARRARNSTCPRSAAASTPRNSPIFTRQFSVMIDAGLPLVQCLEILASQQENKIFQKVLTGTRASVEGGATLSAAMRQYDKVFDALYVNLVEAGETGGILDTILQRLSSYIEKNVKLKRAVKSALGLSDCRLDRGRRRHRAVAVEGRADFRHVVRGTGCGSAVAHQDRHRA